MRWPTVLVMLLAAGVVEARRRPVPDADFGSSGQSCDRNKSWPKLHSCLQRGGNSVNALYELDGAKLVSVRGGSSSDTAAVYLFLFREGVWQRANVYTTVNPTNEILTFGRMKKTRGYKLEVGTVSTVTTKLGENWVGKVTLRRLITTVCLDETGYCRSLFTQCDALIDGKALWSFRGQLAIDNTKIQLSGDTSRAGTICAPPRSLFTAEPMGDPLE
ncbi:MAG TPA: hypothetical protein VLB44_09600 [Kofleriaceae bacterium]|nr:hypothetical protein [Kofleriaceae bacterium]